MCCMCSSFRKGLTVCGFLIGVICAVAFEAKLDAELEVTEILIERAGRAKNVDMTLKAQTDPWGHVFIYEPHDCACTYGLRFIIRSRGPDGLDFTEDDIVRYGFKRPRMDGPPELLDYLPADACEGG